MGTVLGVCVIVGMALLTYLPSMRGDFIGHDDRYLVNSLSVQTAAGLPQVWFDLRANAQYYPLAFTSFRIEPRLWALNHVGYHTVNVLFTG